MTSRVNSARRALVAVDPGYVVSGLLVGILVGATGVGGGSLMTPILLLLFTVPATTAVGTDLLFASITKTVGTYVHGVNRSISWRIVGLLSIGSLPSSGVMLYLLHSVIDRKAVASVMTFALGIALLVTSAAIFAGPWLEKRIFPKRIGQSLIPRSEEEILEAELASETRPGIAAWTVLTGVVLGALVTLTSVGAGALGVMVLLGLYPRVRSVKIVGTDIAHAVPLTLVAGVGHASLGGVNFQLLGSLLLGSIPGVVVGSKLAMRLPERRLKQALASILLIVALKLIL